jgi:hypothetical protein
MGLFDITLRHVVRRHPEELVQALMPASEPIEIVGWIDTQVTSLERRLDKALDLRVGGRRRLLGTEFQLDHREDLPFRVFTYEALLLLGLAAAEEALPPPIETVVILLRGRSEPWPPLLEFRSNWPESAWTSCKHIRLEAVYQRTAAELRARPGTFWLVFTPLARDATAASLREAIEILRRRVARGEERAEMYTALLVMAEIDPWGHNLRKEIKAMLDEVDQELLRLSPTLREAFEDGEQKGKREGIEGMLRALFMRRMGRALTADEQQALAKRAAALDPERAADALLELEGDALAAWLLDPAKD